MSALIHSGAQITHVGDSTKPCRTPKLVEKLQKQFFHFTQSIQPANRFIMRSSSWTGKFIFISFSARQHI